MNNEFPLFLYIKNGYASLLELLKEEIEKMNHQMWTAYTNLTNWLDSWETFAVTQGFVMKVNGEPGLGMMFNEKQREGLLALMR